MNTISKYASLVKFAHTVFALPFALASYFYTIRPYGYWPGWLKFTLMLLCMVFARNAAMGFNRWADRRIDAANPRTGGREIPAGRISARAAMVFVIVNCVLFVVCAGLLNRLALTLSPVALLIILGYSYTKRFTWMSHFVLGLALAIAPVGACIAFSGSISFISLLLGCLVLTWVGGFDILYSLQDAGFDREHKLHSVPSRFSVEQSIGISIGVHLASIVAVYLIGVWSAAGPLYWVGAGLFTLLLIIQHAIVTPKHTGRVSAIFTLVNGLSSIVYAAFFIADLYL